jgi:arylamine N-acetyltransferase
MGGFPTLDNDTQAIALAHLGIKPATPDAHLLAALVDAYVRRVPWESVSRIVHHAHAASPVQPRWPETFWRDAAARGTGGTCFESNFAFAALLGALDYDGYLTVNDMGDTIGCHTAAVVHLDGARWLVDMGYPIHAQLRLQADATSVVHTPWMSYTLHPLGDSVYRLEREPHPMPYMFTLIDRPIALDDYRQRTIDDYGPDGLFLHQVIINRLMNDALWRFNSRELSADGRPVFQEYVRGHKTEHPVTGNLAGALAAYFGMDVALVAEALSAIG